MITFFFLRQMNKRGYRLKGGLEILIILSKLISCFISISVWRVKNIKPIRSCRTSLSWDRSGVLSQIFASYCFVNSN